MECVAGLKADLQIQFKNTWSVSFQMSKTRKFWSLMNKSYSFSLSAVCLFRNTSYMKCRSAFWSCKLGKGGCNLLLESVCTFVQRVMSSVFCFCSLKEPPLLTGVLEPNNKLQKAERLWENQLVGPESIVNIGGKHWEKVFSSCILYFPPAKSSHGLLEY